MANVTLQVYEDTSSAGRNFLPALEFGIVIYRTFATFNTLIPPPKGRTGGVLQLLSHDGVNFTVAEDVYVVFIENLLAIGDWR